MRRGAVWTFAVWMLAAALQPAGAVAVESWSASTGDELARGTLDGTAVDEDGRVGLAPPLETLWGPAEGIVWAVEPDGAGGAYLALSGPGRVIRVLRGREAAILYETPDESLVTAMTADGKDGVLAGLSPEGRVLRIDASGEATPVAETGATFLWAMARDAQGVLWLGTGVPGRLLRVAKDGRVETVFESGDDPVRSMTPLAGGGLVVGTGALGRVIRIDRAGRAFVLFDADETEIVALAANGAGTVFALAAAGQRQPGAPPAEAREAPEIEGGMMRVVVTPTAQNGEEPPVAEEAAAEPSRRPAQRFTSPPGGALYRIDPDGMARKIWETATEMPFDLAVSAQGKLLVATGDEGRIWMLDDEGRSASLLRIPSNQASAVAVGADGAVFIGGTTDARLELLGAGPRAEGAYLGPVVDAGTVADWGRVSWSADVPRDARLSVQARSGNTAEPDETWSDWRELSPDAAGSDVPPARWFQLRANLRAGRGLSPRLGRVDVRYLPRNRPPSVSVLAVEPPGVAWARVPVQPSSRSGPQVADDPVSRGLAGALTRGGRMLGAIRKSYEAGARTFTWTVDDPDEDRLRFSLELQREGGGDWFPLANGLEEEFHSWDSRTVPDGRYRVRLSADDSPDNAGESCRTVRRVSSVFLIDNTRPALGDPQWQRSEDGWRVRFAARDAGGAVAAAEYSLDGGDWLPLVPTDGVADSAEESYEIEFAVPDGRDAPRGLAVRVADEAGNLGGAAWFFPAS